MEGWRRKPPPTLCRWGLMKLDRLFVQGAIAPVVTLLVRELVQVLLRNRANKKTPRFLFG